MNPKLKVIYDQVPGVNCKGLYHGACGPVPATALEREKIRSVYEARPLICRVYGVAEGLRCEHGCWPEKVPSRMEAMILAGQIREVK